MRTTIFFRILLATLLPLVLVLALVISTINTIIYSGGSDYARETALEAARHLSNMIADKVDASSHLLEVASKGLSRIEDYGSTEALTRPLDSITDILTADPEIYSTWFAYEPGVFPSGRRYYRTLTRVDGTISNRTYFTDEIMNDPEKSKWYHIPLIAGRPFLNMLDLYDYGLGEGFIHISTATYPIFSGWRVVGCIGMDFKFEELFNTESLRQGDRWKTMIVDGRGRILSYDDETRTDGGLLWDFGFPDQEAMTEALASGAEYQTEAASPLTGETAFISLLPITLEFADQPIYLYLDIPVDDLYASARSSTDLIYSTSVMGCLLLIFCVFVATRNIVRPIRELTVNFDKVVNSDQDQAADNEIMEKATPTTVVELAKLQDSLGQMISQIQKAHELSLAAAEERVEKERVLAASDAKTRFFANMSHEIRTPMNAILGISEILLHDEPLTEKQTKYIGDIQISSDSLLTIINDILDLSKLESGRLELNPVNYDFPKLLANIHTLVQSLADNKHLIFSHEETGDIPRCLYGDDVRLRQVLLNILSNAVKFTREGTVALKVAAEKDRMVFVVSDTGIGIKSEDRTGLFQPFKQMDTTRNRDIQGTGLGLSISSNLVELMGGTIELESVYGHGSAFTITVPKVLGDETSLERKTKAQRVVYSPELRILVVDDNAINLSVAAGLLRTIYGLGCDQVFSGYEALEKLQAADYDLVFMDHMMPGMDGVEATRRIRALGGKFSALPVIALTANAVQGTCEMLMAAGFSDFLSKPIIREELDAILFKWVPDPLKRVEAVKDEPQAARPAPAAPVSALLAEAGKIEEIDLAAGLASVENETAIYEDMLRLLNDEIQPMNRLLTDLLSRRELSELSIHVHALKSSLASVGALGLSNLARDLEAASAAEDLEFCRVNLPEFSRRFAGLGRRLSAILTPGAAVEEAGPSQAGLAGADFDRLRQGLSVYDFEVIQEALKTLLAQEHAPEAARVLAEVKKLLRSFDYDRAAALLADGEHQ